MRNNAKGYTFIELTIAALILGVMVSSVLMSRKFVAVQTLKAKEKSFATQKSIQMFEELRSLVSGSEQQGIVQLDDFDDGSKFNSFLTTDTSVTTSTDPLSGNMLFQGGWKYWRQVQVSKMPSDPYARVVSVRVYKSNFNKPVLTSPTTVVPGDLLAQVGGLLRTIVQLPEATQVYDAYCLALSNGLGWFTLVPAMSNAFSEAVSDVQKRNPGLEFRTHYITQFGYGRDPLYKPFINVNRTTVAASSPWAYLYPGLTPDTSNVNWNFFDAQQLLAVGNILTDQGAGFATQVNSSTGFAMCDLFNNDMRYPDELTTYAAVSQAAVAGGGTAPEMTLRMLLEKLNTQPVSMKNALLVSMHGEVIPIPAIRNYSDAAKDPVGNPYVRAVAHPENLHYKSAATTTTLRVYAYYDGMPTGMTVDSFAATNLAPVISIRLPNMALSATDLAVTAVTGGTYPVGTTTAYALTGLATGAVPGTGAPMSWSVSSGGGATTILLYNTPLRAVTHTGGTGLPNAYRLYDREYIPCPPTSTTSFAQNLTNTGTAVPKNTARWIIRIIPAVAAGQKTVETRIGADTTTGTLANQPLNLSRTYFWTGLGSGNPGDTTCGVPPWTERFQFNGDPRHMPYLDVKFGEADTGVVTIDDDSYNWYFKNIEGVDGYSGYTKTDDQYGGNNSDRDMPKYYYTYRRGILQSGAIFVNLNGYTCWHAAQGGEFGSVYSPFANSISFVRTPWEPTSATIARVNEVQSGGNFSAAMNIASYAAAGNLVDRWYAKTWMGENFPDNLYTTWAAYGNLPVAGSAVASSTGATFYRVPTGSITQTTTTTLRGFDRSTTYEREVGGFGPQAFLNGTSSSATRTFMHSFSSAAATLTTLGYNLYGTVGFPLASPVSCARPWAYQYDTTVNTPPEWADAYYSGIRTTISMPTAGATVTNRVFYENSNGTADADSNDTPNLHGVGTMKVKQVTGGVTATGYVIVSGLAPQGNFGSVDLTKISISSMVRSFMDAGNYTGVDHITQVPLVKIYTCKNTGDGTYPVTIDPVPQYASPNSVTLLVGGPITQPVTLAGKVGKVVLTNPWYRYRSLSPLEANFYTEEYPAASGALTLSTYSESVTLFYNLKYSTDHGTTWYFVQTDGAAQKGVYSAANAIASGGPITNVQYVWNIANPNQFPQGTYLVMAEAYRPQSANPLHYAYHQVEVSVNR